MATPDLASLAVGIEPLARDIINEHSDDYPRQRDIYLSFTLRHNDPVLFTGTDPPRPQVHTREGESQKQSCSDERNTEGRVLVYP